MAANIEPKQANALIKRLATVAPLSGLEHLNRIRKAPGGEGAGKKLQIIVYWPHAPAGDGGTEDGCPVPAAATQADAGMPLAVQEVVDEFQLVLFSSEVPLHAPIKRLQLEEWGKVWPIKWRPPDPHLTMPRGSLPDAELAAVRNGMAACLRLEDSVDGACNAALIVDPATCKAVAQGVDQRERHPLWHAAMIAIEAAAERDRRLWPDPSGGEGAHKKRRLSQDGDASRENAVCAGSKPYLCTGMWAFLAAEPCAMCAMALVHSRVARVVFCRPDPQRGALGGAFALHQQRGLNHRYEVYRLPLKEGGVSPKRPSSAAGGAP
eukprot:jgi/Tetstr1/433333/TSEL_022619.t1